MTFLTVLALLSVLGGQPAGRPWWEKVLRVNHYQLLQTAGWVREPCSPERSLLNTEFTALDSRGRYQEGLVCCEGFQDPQTQCTFILYGKPPPPPPESVLMVEERDPEEEQ